MKRSILTLLVLAPVMLFAQEKYVIKGKIGSIKAPAKIYLNYKLGSKTVTDSTVFNNGSFKFSGEVNEITKGGLVIDYKGAGYSRLNRKVQQDAISVFLIKGTTTFSSPDSLVNAKAHGTKLNEDNQRFEALLKPITIANNALEAEYHAAPKGKKDSKEFNDYIDKKQDAIDAQEKELDRKFIEDNPDSYMSLQAIKGLAGYYPDYKMLQTMYAKLTPEIKASKQGADYQKYLDGLKAVAVGHTAPDFAQADTSGKLIRLSSFRGKYVLLDFWASWCGPCRRENPNVVKAYNKYKDKNFTILGVSLDKPGRKAAWLKAIHTDGLTWTHISDLKFWDNEAAKLYAIHAIPQNLLIDPNGKIIAKYLTGEDLEKKLEELFGKM